MKLSIRRSDDRRRIGVSLMLVLLLTGTGCHREEVAYQSQLTPFFDLEGYMQGQIDDLQERQPRVQKRISVGGQIEEKTLERLDYENELAIFRNVDINRPAWLDKYEVDSLFQAGELQSVTYTTDNKKLSVKLLRIDYKEGRPSQILAEKITNTVLSEGKQDLAYIPGSGYRIRSVQKNTLGKSTDVLIETAFLK